MSPTTSQLTHSPPPALRITGLEKHYSRVRALDGIDVTVPKGAIYGFIGPNGAGKTTTIRILAGLIRPTRGDVTLQGHDLAADRVQAARGLRTLVEVPAFYPSLTGQQNLGVFAKLARAPKGDVDRLLEAVGLTHAAKRAVGGYSLGMRQRLGIAQALVGHPTLVVLDEPMNGLDPAAIHLVRTLIQKERSERGVTFFLSSHLLHDVETLCDHVGVLHRGRMVTESDMATMLEAPVEGYRLETSDNAKAAKQLREFTPTLAPDESFIDVLTDARGIIEVQQALLYANIDVRSLAPLRKDLERLFIDMTEGVMG